MNNTLKYKIAEYSEAHLQKMTWGYTSCESLNLSKAILYSSIFDREELRKRYGSSCICPDLLVKLKYQTNRIAGKTKIDKTLFSNPAGKNFWQYTHPHCIRLTHYQKWCNQFLCDLQVTIALYNKEKCDLDVLTFISEKEACDLTLDSIKTTISHLCKIDVDVAIKEEGCDVGAQVFVAQKYCKVENDFKLNEHLCNIAYEDFITQHGCNIGFSNWKKATSTFNC